MSQLAIKGHATRGREVIQLLEMLGGKNAFNLDGTMANYYYYIDNSNNKIYHCLSINLEYGIVYTLEEFEKKFPYKVGDKVITKDKFIGTITDIKWQGDIVYTVQVSTTVQITYPVAHLQPCKEETLQERIDKSFEQLNQKIFQAKECACNIRLELIKEENMEGVYAYNEINCYHQDFGDKVRIRLGDDFEIKVEDKITYIVKKQPQYPKTYDECCEVLNTYCTMPSRPGYKEGLIAKFQELLICRDAYWKVAGEELGLGKPWKPRWNNNYQTKWVINFYQDEINLTNGPNVHFILVFPTPEMRNAFYENFKEEIEMCKELL